MVRPFADLYPFQPHFLETEAGALHYVDEGPRDAPVILCVHGNPTWSLLYRQVVQRFRRTQRVIAIDHLGCGLSDQPREFGYRFTDHARNLEQLVVELDLTNITLIVHDWGGPIGMTMAARQRERIARLVLTNTGLFPSERIPWRIDMCRGWLGRILIEGHNAFARAAVRMAVEQPLDAKRRRAYLTPYAPPRSSLATWRFVDDIPMEPEHPSYGALAEVAATLPRFADTPTLLLWGEQDWCFSTHFRDELAARMPWAERADLVDAGHYLFEDDPAGVEAALAGFLV